MTNIKHDTEKIGGFSLATLTSLIGLLGSVGGAFILLATKWDIVEPMLTSPVFRIIAFILTYVSGMITYHLLRVPSMNSRLESMKSEIRALKAQVLALQEVQQDHIRNKAQWDLLLKSDLDDHGLAKLISGLRDKVDNQDKSI